MRSLALLLFLAGCAGVTLPPPTTQTGATTTTPTPTPTEDCGEVDSDDDGLFDDCDDCPDDAENDEDGDGVCFSDDVCPGGDDNIDTDSDTAPDACDTCPNDPLDDEDGDGVCGDLDQCPGWDDNGDIDQDTIPNGCDACPYDPDNDDDADGVCGDVDVCPGGDDTVDTDADGGPDDCDICPNDPLDDWDADGVCGDVDICPGGDDTIDLDGNGVPDACEAGAGGLVDLTPSTGNLVQDDVVVWADKAYIFDATVNFSLTGAGWYCNPPVGTTLIVTVYDAVTQAQLAQSAAVAGQGVEAWYDIPIALYLTAGQSYAVTFHTSAPAQLRFDRMDAATDGYSVPPWVGNVRSVSSIQGGANAPPEFPGNVNSWFPMIRIEAL